jgi:beta-N-acetylhexosaminidase
MLDLTSKPFYLSNHDIQWVNETLNSMDLPAKVGQLFCLMCPSLETDKISEMLEIKPGGFVFRPAPGAQLQQAQRFAQAHSTIPLLLAADLERGGTGVVADGTSFSSPMGVAATNDVTQAYRLGLVCGREGRAAGTNWSFAPIIDLDYNFHNPITNTRTFGSDPERVLRMARAYMKGIQECGMAVSIKHWPGDGIDGRDQHLLISCNTLTPESWDATYGRVYKGMIDAGAETVMAAHIMLPAYSRKFLPGIKNEEILPSSLAPELNNQLLRQQLGFNGLIVTDATAMAGFTIAMPRAQAVPAAIMAGCDMFLFTINLQEDFNFMLQGVQNGALTIQRLDEAVTAILALKASLKLHQQQAEGTLVPDESALSVIGCTEHKAWAAECAEKAVTLVKDTQALLPLSPEKHRRILLYVLGDTPGFFDATPGSSTRFIQRLEEKGFVVTRFDYSARPDFGAMNRSIQETRGACDLILYYAALKTPSFQTTVRINWAQPMGRDAPKWIHEVPTAFISVENPYHLQDAPRVKTYINAYTANEYVVDALVDKLVGISPFQGVSPVDPFCGYWDARL